MGGAAGEGGHNDAGGPMGGGGGGGDGGSKQSMLSSLVWQVWGGVTMTPSTTTPSTPVYQQRVSTFPLLLRT